MVTIKSARNKNLVVFAGLLLLAPQWTWAWGMRGHQVVCEAAIFSVRDPELSRFLKERVPMITHLCNIPDTSWKSQTPEITATGSFTHYIDPEVTGLKIPELGLDYRDLQKRFEGTENKAKPGEKILSLPRELGSVWWRADQFLRRGTEFMTAAKATKAPQNRGEEQDSKLPYNLAIYGWLQNIGLMGHFVGDAGQPYHGTFDYDGYGTGQGGAHRFYEENVVAEQDGKLTADVIDEAARLRKKADMLAKIKRDPTKNKELAFLLLPQPTAKMQALSDLSVQDLPAIRKIDVVKKKSEIKNEKGMELKTPAERDLTPKMVKDFRPLQVKHMARSAALLAEFWEKSYRDAGRPDLTGYKWYRYPFEPEFIAPDYLNAETKKENTK